MPGCGARRLPRRRGSAASPGPLPKPQLSSALPGSLLVGTGEREPREELGSRRRQRREPEGELESEVGRERGSERAGERTREGGGRETGEGRREEEK